MADLMELVHQQLGTGGVQQIASQLGTSPDTTQTAIHAALPMLLGSMASRASQPGGVEELHQTIDAHAGAAAAEQGGRDPGFLHGGAGGGGLVGRILGQHQPHVEQAVSQSSALDPAKTGKLLMLLTPIVLAALARKRQQEGLQPSQLPQVLTQGEEAAHQQATQHSCALGGMLSGLMGKLFAH